ncbi:hypothetical protein JF50_14775 [Pseudoalteromonas luteoviolacea]|uniref:Uncharacterized protein n=1 Tax=Pseudoalteromonas luteoviolacea TaxID=43657 RepID=A0A0C1Q526_9GAMM|nr:hypothetical protein [Pseudoalteromonas luteoviolacea]KID55661.1 hypothetical protein JF50_14775 [Pseudoalteromonas luteoviolacea]
MDQIVDFLIVSGVLYKGLQASLFIAFLYTLYVTRRRGYGFFCDRRHKLDNPADRDLVSWHITIVTLFVMQLIDHILQYSLVALDLDYVVRRRLFYFSRLFSIGIFIVSVVALHSLRGCSFSRYSRAIVYVLLPISTTTLIQLVLRGYLDIEVFRPWHRLVACISQLAYPIIIFSFIASQLYADFKQRASRRAAQ